MWRTSRLDGLVRTAQYPAISSPECGLTLGSSRRSAASATRSPTPRSALQGRPEIDYANPTTRLSRRDDARPAGHVGRTSCRARTAEPEIVTAESECTAYARTVPSAIVWATDVRTRRGSFESAFVVDADVRSCAPVHANQAPCKASQPAGVTGSA